MDLETRVAILESQMQILLEQTIPLISSQVDTLFSQVQTMQATIQQLIDSGSISTGDINKLIDVLYNFSKAKYNFVEYSQAEIDFYKAMKELKGVK